MTDTLPPFFPEGVIDYEPLEEGFAVQLPDTVARTDVEEGPADQESIFRNAPATFSCAWPMDNVQYEIFLGALAATGGAYTWHSAPVWRGSSYETMAVRVVKGTLNPVRDNGEWIVHADLETTSFRPWSATDTAAAMLTYGSTISLDELVELYRATLTQLGEAMRP